MPRTHKPHIPRISFAMTPQDGELTFTFHGTNRQTIINTFSHLSSLCTDCLVTSEQLPFINGKCNYNIIATLSEPRTDILSPADWPMTVTRFLQKELICEVTYFDDYNKFLNA